GTNRRDPRLALRVTDLHLHRAAPGGDGDAGGEVRLDPGHHRVDGDERTPCAGEVAAGGLLRRRLRRGHLRLRPGRQRGPLAPSGGPLEEAHPALLHPADRDLQADDEVEALGDAHRSARPAVSSTPVTRWRRVVAIRPATSSRPRPRATTVSGPRASGSASSASRAGTGRARTATPAATDA